LREPIVKEPKGKWFCDDCCELLGYPPGTILDPEQPKRKSSGKASSNAKEDDQDMDEASDKASNKKRRSSSGKGKEKRETHANPSSSSSSSQPSEKKIRIQADSSSSSHPYPKSKLLNKQQANDHFQKDMAMIQACSSAANDSNELDDGHTKIEDDKCFVCNESGNVIICDFPGCPRVYHQVCIFTSLPASSLMPDRDIDLAHLDGDRWYCPRHFCIQCSAIDTPGMMDPSRAKPADSETLPASSSSSSVDDDVTGTFTVENAMHMDDSSPSIDLKIVSQTQSETILAPVNPTKHNPYAILPRYLHGVASYIQCKSLRSCSLCPFAICMSCEQDLTTSATLASDLPAIEINNHRSAVFKSKRGVLSGKSLECVNCHSPSSHIQLAKVLEKAWLRLASSRLSIPFLRPLLPIPGQDEMPMHPAGDDIISISEKIRCLQYTSSTDFVNDLVSLRANLISKLVNSLALRYDEDSNRFSMHSSSSSSTSTSSSGVETAAMILSGFDTVFEACKAYLVRDRGILVDSLAKKIKEQQLQKQETPQHHPYAGVMIPLWRKECRQSVAANLMLSSSSGKLAHQRRSLADRFFITGRELEAWSKHISEGVIPDQRRGGRIDPWGIWNPLSSFEVNGGIPSDGHVKHYRYQQSNLNNFFAFVREEALEQEAVRAMLMMDGRREEDDSLRYDRETVTLLEDSSIDVSPWNKFHSTAVTSQQLDARQEGGEKLAEDETGIMLERLRDLTTKSLHLQVHESIYHWYLTTC
jgi:hypothetical protein